MTFEQYKIIKDAYLDFYPDDRIDIAYCDGTLTRAFDLDAAGKPIDEETENKIKRLGYGLKVIIYLPEITVTSEDGKQSHTIYDVYVSITFPSMLIELGRTTYTMDEVSVGYIHSHVPRGNFMFMERFCTGSSSTPINVIINKILYNRYSDFSLLIQSFIITTERMLKVESASGGPYIYMNTIGSSINPVPINVKLIPGLNFDFLTSKTRNKVADFIEYYCSLNLDKFYYDGRSWQLDASDAEFITRVTKVAKTFRNFKDKSLWHWQDNIFFSSGLYYEKKKSMYTVPDGCNTNWIFKNKRIPIKVIDNSDIHAIPVTILRRTVLDILYTFLINFVNSYYANTEIHKDSLYSRAHKIKAALIRKIRG